MQDEGLRVERVARQSETERGEAGGAGAAQLHTNAEPIRQPNATSRWAT